MFKVDLSTFAVGEWFDPLPEAVATLPASQLADLGDGTGFWPKREVNDPYDPQRETLELDATPVAVPADRVVEVRFRVVPLPADRLAFFQRRRDAEARVNQEAGEARARFITVATGQEGTYVEKAREARAFLADPDPDPANYPYLSAESRYTGGTLKQIAVLVDETERAWTAVNAEIEGLRRGATTRARTARNDMMLDIVFPIAWPTPS